MELYCCASKLYCSCVAYKICTLSYIHIIIVTFIDETGAFGWRATPKSWNYVLLKPYTQNASVWELIKTDEEVGTGIYSLTPTLTHRNDGIIYDLSGRQMPHGRLPRGIYIRNGKKVVR